MFTGHDTDGLHDCQREWDTDRKATAFALFGIYLYGAADLFDFAVHHIHPDTTSGKGRYGLGGGESAMQNQLQQLLLWWIGLFVNQSHFNGTFVNRLEIHASAIIFHAHYKLGRFSGNGYAEPSFCRLFELAPACGLLNAMNN